MEEYERLASDVSIKEKWLIGMEIHRNLRTVVGMDPPYDAMVEFTPDRQLVSRCTEEIGGIPYVSSQT